MNNELTLEDLVIGEEYLYDFYDRSGSNWTSVVIDYIGKFFIVAHTVDDNTEFTFGGSDIDNLKSKSVEVEKPIFEIEFILGCHLESQRTFLNTLTSLSDEVLVRLASHKSATKGDREVLALLLERSANNWKELAQKCLSKVEELIND